MTIASFCLIEFLDKNMSFWIVCKWLYLKHLVINGSGLRSREFAMKPHTFNTWRPIIQRLIFQRMSIIHWIPTLHHILQFGYGKVFIFLILVLLIDFRRFNSIVFFCKMEKKLKDLSIARQNKQWKNLDHNISYFDPSGIKIEVYLSWMSVTFCLHTHCNFFTTKKSSSTPELHFWNFSRISIDFFSVHFFFCSRHVIIMLSNREKSG